MVLIFSTIFTFIHLAIVRYSVVKMAEVPNRVVTDIDYWEKRWEAEETGFHRTHVQPFLLEYFEQLTKGRSNLKILVPLCGKSMDMKWLHDQGHTVIGIEVVPSALVKFFDEQKLEYTKVNIKNKDTDCTTTVYKSLDNKIRLYCCDMLKFTESYEGQFDGIWDRGGLVAVSPSDTKEYANLICSLLKSDGRYLLESPEYDQTKHLEAPHYLATETLQTLFGNQTVEQLARKDGLGDRHRSWGLDEYYVRLFIIKHKKPSIMSEEEKKQTTLDAWKRCWQEDSQPWDTGNEVTELLKRSMHVLIGSSDSPGAKKAKKTMRFFFPLCGKIYDMKWLYDRGHSVVGVEIAQQAVELFYKEHDIKYTVSSLNGMKGSLYKSNDGQMSIYCCDLFSLESSVIGQFDVLYDRAALTAIRPDDRARYCTLMASLLKDDGRYLLEMFHIVADNWQGPPFSLDEDGIRETYGEHFDVEVINREDVTDSWRSAGVTAKTDITYLLSLRNE